MERKDKARARTARYLPAAGSGAGSRGATRDRSSSGLALDAMVQLLKSSPQVTAQLALNERLASGSTSPVQRVDNDEDELLQGKFTPVQRSAEEDELLQGKFDPAQRMEDEEEPLQAKSAPIQRTATADAAPQTSHTGLPEGLKSGIEGLSGMSLDQVRVHYNSPRPAQLRAHAFAQGSDIHLAPGQERHLPHEAWHVVQQAQGRVRPTLQMHGGVPVNDDAGLEHEADVMGAKALAAGNSSRRGDSIGASRPLPSGSAGQIAQRVVKLKDASAFGEWPDKDNSDEPIALDYDCDVLDAIVDELIEDFDWNHSRISAFMDQVISDNVYAYEDFDDLNDRLEDPGESDMEEEDLDQKGMELETIAEHFGSTFKNKSIPFSGSRVYAVGMPNVRKNNQDKVWATQNSATGLISSKQRGIVKTWAAKSTGMSLDMLNMMTFPSNTKPAMGKGGLERPSVMASNAHAEVNQYVQLALFAAHEHLTINDVGLLVASDIAHCAECFWALNAMAKKSGGNFRGLSGCENKLFARWREPWSGFYTEFGANPFRNKDGSLKKYQGNQPLTPGSVDPKILNYLSGSNIYN